MKKDSRSRGFILQGSRFKVNPHSLCLRGFLLLVMVLVGFSLVMGCKKKEKAPPAPPSVEQKAMELAPALAGKQKVPETLVQDRTQAPTFHSLLTKDLNRPNPATSFSKNDRIYLLTDWTGLQGPHEIKVLWIRPDKNVQETVRLKENISSNSSKYSSWAYLSFNKGLLNISPMEGKFIGPWKAQLFLDGKFLKEYDFSVF
jgi:hypothetical protein